MNSEVNAYIEKAVEGQQEVLTELRKLILDAAPDAEEQFKWSRPVYALKKDFCYLQTTKKHVTLGFFEFDKVVTNKHLIEGTGKSMRHVKINQLSDLEEFQLGAMLQEVLS